MPTLSHEGAGPESARILAFPSARADRWRLTIPVDPDVEAITVEVLIGERGAGPEGALAGITLDGRPVTFRPTGRIRRGHRGA